MKIQILKNETYQSVDNLPKKGTDRATGYDVIATSGPEIIGETNDRGGYKRVDYIQYRTNLKLAVQKDRVFSNFGYNDFDHDILAFPRSSISKYNLVLANCIGLIDADYRGEVLLRFKYIFQPEDYNIIDNQIIGGVNQTKIYSIGDKICQLKVTKVENVEFTLVDELDVTDRGDGGFGSTDIPKPTTTTSVATGKSIEDLIKQKEGYFQANAQKYSDMIKERDNKIFGN
jgi:dUTPase